MPTFRFRPGKDDDLREWYNSLPEGERSRKIRRILKQHINNNVIKEKPKLKIKESNKTNCNTEKKIDILMEQF